MRFLCVSALVLGLAQSVYSQAGTQASLLAAVSKYPDLSAFSGILSGFPGILPTLLGGSSNGVTVLVPTNAAITKFLGQGNVTDISQFPVAQLQTVLRYHILAAKLKTENFTLPRGLTIPTILKDVLYNNRTAGKGITDLYGPDATGQVLFVQKDPIAKPSKFKVRQSLSGSSASLRAGLAQVATLTAVDGVWDGGYFQVVDK